MSLRLSPAEQRRFDLVPPDVAERARVVPVRWMTPGFAATTLGRIVLVRRDRRHDEALVAHELVHVRQWQERGAARFLVRYLAEWLRGLARLRRPHAAYLAISFEVEARAQARRWAQQHRSPAARSEVARA